MTEKKALPITNSIFDDQALFDALYEGIYIVDRFRQITYWNQSAKKITGFSKEEAVGKYCHDNLLNHIDAEGRQLCLGSCPLERAMSLGEIQEIDAFLVHKRGHLIPVKSRMIPIKQNGEIVGCVEVFVENMETGPFNDRMCIMNNKLLKDALTGLPNRKYLEEVVLTKLDDYEKIELPFGLAIADIDNFEGINDTFGRVQSDELLALLSKTYKHTFRAAELIARWQNDEFVFVFTGITNEQLNRQCEKIRLLSEGSTLRSQVFQNIDFTVSVGGTVVRKGDTLDSIMNRLKDRLKKAKSKGGNSCVTR